MSIDAVFSLDLAEIRAVATASTATRGSSTWSSSAVHRSRGKPGSTRMSLFDDYPRAVEAAWGHYSQPDDDEPQEAEIEAMRVALNAALAALPREELIDTGVEALLRPGDHTEEGFLLAHEQATRVAVKWGLSPEDITATEER